MQINARAGGARPQVGNRGAATQPRRHRPDYWLLILMMLLLTVGIIIIYAISPALTEEKHVSNNYYVIRQLIAVALGAGLFAFTAKVPLVEWRRSYKVLLGLAIGATLVALAMPVNPNYPAHRWIRLGAFSFQSVELVKFALLMWFAGFLSDRIQKGTLNNFHQTMKPLIYVLVAIGVVIVGIQSDLGSTGVILVMMTVMGYVAGLPLKRILLVGAAILAILILAVSTTPYRRERLLTFMHPASDCLASGYQVCQALIAVGSGGTIGLGLGRSVQAYGYLPEAENDSIFAIYAEKFGFVGVAAFLVILMAFFSRLRNVAARAPDNFSRLVVSGVLVWLSTQATINIGAMLGLLPLKGITLPFISYGGSSVLLVMAAVGVVFNISRYTGFTTPEEDTITTGNGGYDENRRDGRRLRGAYHPTFGSRS